MNPAHGPDKEGCCLNTEFGKNMMSQNLATMMQLNVLFLLYFPLCTQGVALTTSLRLRVPTTRVVAASSPNLVKTIQSYHSPNSTYKVAARMTSQLPVGQIRKAADATLLRMVAVRTSSHPHQDLMER